MKHLLALSQQVLEACRQRGQKLATAESCTGGLVTAVLTEIAGSSDVVECGFVTYSNSAKQRMLDVSAKTLADYGAVSEEVAAEMALGALGHSEADIAVSITGIAGPGGSDFKPEGRVCFGLAVHGTVKTFLIEFGPLGRENVRNKATEFALLTLLGADFPDTFERAA